MFICNLICILHCCKANVAIECFLDYFVKTSFVRNTALNRVAIFYFLKLGNMGTYTKLGICLFGLSCSQAFFYKLFPNILHSRFYFFDYFCSVCSQSRIPSFILRITYYSLFLQMKSWLFVMGLCLV